MVVWIYIMKGLINTGNKKQQYFNKNDNCVLFKDIGGNEDAKASLQEIIDYIKHPEVYQERRIRLPRGVLLYGPPGTGKTMIAKAVANECNIHFIYAWGSDFVEIFVGQGPKRIRELFREARQNDKCIIFIDEIDSLGYERNKQSLWKESDNTLNQLLSEMDGFSEVKGIVVIGATNQPDILDPALLRPGRFDRKIGKPFLYFSLLIEIRLPNEKERTDILSIHLSTRSDVDEETIEKVASQTEGVAGCDLENIVNEASFIAMRRLRISGIDGNITNADIEGKLSFLIP